MGKYMKKSKTTTDDNRVMKVSEPTTTIVGVRTRAAKTLALKRLNFSTSASDSSLKDDASCYLQLRSRRLEKPSSLVEPKQLPRLNKSGIKESGLRSRVDSVPVATGCNRMKFLATLTRESTPCNVTPGSSTRSMRGAIKDYTSDLDIMVPTASELEEFFAYAEKRQQRLFMEKYNFDIVNDVPLTGSYEWVQVSQ